MRMFVTGATGYIGSAVVRDLLDAGHEVVGLARSDTAAAALTAAGADVHRGALEDLDRLHDGAAAADGVIHTAFDSISETSGCAASDATDVQAVETMGAALKNSDRPFVVTSGTLVLILGRPALTLGRLGTESDVPDASVARVASENAAIALAEHGVRSSVVRLAPSVHGKGDEHGFVPTLIGIARDKGVSAFVGNGANRWPAVHRLDAARLFRLAAETAPAGSRLHGAGEQGVPFQDIAEAIGRQLDLPVISLPPEDAGDHFGSLATLVSADNPTSSAETQAVLGWQPEGPALIADIKHGHYFVD